jgi:hypothetical protein
MRWSKVLFLFLFGTEKEKMDAVDIISEDMAVLRNDINECPEYFGIPENDRRLRELARKRWLLER